MNRILLLLCFWPVIGFAQQPGDLDLSFDGDGKVMLLDFDSITTSGVGPLIVTTEDLKTVVAFGCIVEDQARVRLIRLSTDGSIDASWGGGENVYAEIGRLKDLEILPNGKVIVIGQQYNSPIKVQQFLATGQLDFGYGSNGTAEIQNTSSHQVEGFQLLPDGRMLGFLRGLIFRLLQNGEIDDSFGDNGFYATPSNDGPYDLVINSNGGIYWSNIPGYSYLDYNGQNLARQVYLNLPPYSKLFKKLVLNDMGALIAHVSVPPPVWSGSGSSVGFAHANGFSHITWNTLQEIWVNAYVSSLSQLSSYGSIYTHVLLGPIFSDQMGNFFGAWAVTSTTQLSPPPKAWFVRKYYPTNTGSMPEDQSFGDYPYPYSYFNGLQTHFDTLYLAVPTSGTAQHDGKIIIAGYSDLSVGKRLALARYHNIPDPRSKLHLKMFLGGPYDTATGLMNDHLRQQSLIPFIQPYQPPAFQPKNGVGTWGLGAGVLDLQGDSAIVDWVWLELLDPDSIELVKATRVGLLHRNGSVTAADGVSPIDFSIGSGSYILRVRHRNHLSVTLADPITLGLDPIEVDLTSPATATFGTDAQKEVDGVMVLWPGDATGNDEVKYMGAQNDRDAILISIGGMVPTATATGYLKQDVNLDGAVKYMGPNNDRDVILQTIGGDVPTAVRVEQGP
jgi:uncharacterized delta-60 repeat protein